METDESIVLGGGCFWGVEDAFKRVKGVTHTTVGYAGGMLENPSYEEVCTGRTGHAEVVKVNFNPQMVTLAEILDVFWRIHNPATLNRQGNDIGTQYRSLILYHPSQEQEVVRSLDTLIKSGVKATTEIGHLDVFYPAEEYHQDYLQKHPNGYCHIPQKVLKELGEPQNV